MTRPPILNVAPPQDESSYTLAAADARALWAYVEWLEARLEEVKKTERGLVLACRDVARLKLTANRDATGEDFDELTIWAHACPECLTPVLVGERNSRGWWVCRTCGKRQRSPMLIPVRGVGRGGVRR